MKLIRKIVRVLHDGVITARKTDLGRWTQFAIFFDSIYCRLRFHTTNDEYLDYQFYNHKNCYRKNYLLTYHQRNQYKYITEKGFTRSKYRFYQRIPDCYYREIILAPVCGEDCFLEFVQKHQKIVTKPDTGSYGGNIEIYSYTNDDQARKYFSCLPDNTICEQYILQHETMNGINPFSVNTIRIVTLLDGETVNIISATLRTGSNADTPVDNLRQNGIGAQVDIATGIVSTCGFDYNKKLYMKHPVSGVQFLGLTIPNWSKAIALVKTAHSRLPQCKLLGWDIAITQTGADIVEANNAPGTPIMQMVDLIPKGEKVLQTIREEKRKSRHLCVKSRRL